MKKPFRLILPFWIFLIACRTIPSPNDVQATAVSTITPTITQTAIAVPTITPQPTNTPEPAPTTTPTATPETAVILDDTLLLYAAVQDNNWALKTYPYNPAFSGDVFDHFYGPTEPMEDVRRYTQFNFGPQLSPNGRYLLLPGVGGYGGNNTGFWLVNLQTDEARLLLRRPEVATWSPYGNQITYVDANTLYTLSVAEGAEPQPQFTRPNLWGLYARWSPDGQYIATMTTVQNQPDELGSPELQNTYWLVSVYDQLAVQLAERADYPMEYAAEEMTWSPTGRYLLVRNQVFDLDGRQLSPEFPGGAHWLPASKQMENSGQEPLLVNGHDGLLIMTIEGEELTRISDAFVDTWAFSHDGRFLAYLNPHGETDLIIFDLDSQETRHLGPIPQNIFTLQWSGNDDFLLMDDGGLASPIWALAVEPGSPVQVVVNEGTLIATLPMPMREVAPVTAVTPPSATQSPQSTQKDDIIARLETLQTQYEQMVNGYEGWLYARRTEQFPTKLRGSEEAVNFLWLEDTWVWEEWYEIIDGQVNRQITHISDEDGGIWQRQLITDGWTALVLPIETLDGRVKRLDRPSINADTLWGPSWLLQQLQQSNTLNVTAWEAKNLYHVTLYEQYEPPIEVVGFDIPLAASRYHYVFDSERALLVRQSGESQLTTGAWEPVLNITVTQFDLLDQLPASPAYTLHEGTSLLSEAH